MGISLNRLIFLIFPVFLFSCSTVELDRRISSVGADSYFENKYQPRISRRPSSHFQIDARDLESAIADRRKKLPEFEFLAQWGAQHGVRIYGAGGTAAGLAHYVKQDLEREYLKERGLPKKYFDSRFGYDYYDVYRSTQDADIVIDLPGGDKAQHEELARKLESEIQSKFPHTQGSKSVWEVRFLKVGRGTPGDAGYKDALLSPDFLNQHSDSHSTGLIELTDPAPPESPRSIVKDAKAWGQPEVPFLRDVTDSVLTYYYEPDTHFKTLRAKNGLNPEILSVIRYYTKAFQYGLKTNPKQEEHIRKIIQGFDPSAIRDSYVRKQINNNGLKLFWHAQDVEFAWNELQRMGLRQKLVQFGDPNQVGTVSQWLNREPLRSKPVGLGSGKTARELGITITAHETNQFLAYENITRSTSGIPNVFISQENAPGESAAHGNGFYTRIGREGARGTGLTIRFEWDPEAREGTDFTKVGDYVMILNRNAVRIIEEGIELEPYDYFKLLFEQKAADHSNLGLYEKLERKVNAKLTRMTATEKERIHLLVKEQIKVDKPNWNIWKRWFSLLISKQYPEFVEALIQKGTVDKQIAEYVLSQPHWKDHPEFVEALIQRGKEHRAIAENVLSQPHWKDHPELVEALIQKGTADGYIAYFVLSQPHWAGHPELVEALIKKGTVDESIAYAVLIQPHWAGHPEWVEALIQKGTADLDIAVYILSQPHWKDHPEWVEALINKGTVDEAIAWNVLSQPHWKDHPEWVKALIKKGTVDREIAEYVLSQPHCKDHPEFVEALIRKGTVDEYIAIHILSQPHWAGHPELVEALIKKGTVDEEITEYVLSEPHWKDHPRLRRLSGGAEPTVANIRAGLKRVSKCEDLLK